MSAEKTRYPAAKQLASEISAGKVQANYLFIGEEEGEKDSMIARITERVLGKGYDRAAAGRFHMEMDDLVPAAEFALMRSMFSEKKVCVMINIQALSAGGRNASLLAEVLIERPDGVTLFMTTPENRPPKILGEELMKDVRVYHFWPPYEKDMLARLREKLSEANVRIDRGGADLLLSRTGRDARKLDEAIDLIATSFAGASVGVQDIAALVEDGRDTTMYEFADAMFSRDRKAFLLLKKLIENNQPELVVLGQLFRQAEQIELYHSLVHQGMPGDEAAQKAGVRARSMESFLRQARANPRSRLARIFPMLCAADYRLKSARPSKSFESRPLFQVLVELLGDTPVPHT
jgi:DNA polymerase III delta subunit